MRRFFLSLAIAAVFLESGCGKEPTRPAVTDVRFALTATPDVGGPSAPITVRGRVTNAGNTRVWHCSGCGCGDGLNIKILGPDGSEVALRDPKAVGPAACPDGFEPIEPGETFEPARSFTGILYERDSPVYPTPTYPAPPGTYTVIADLGYLSGEPGVSREWVTVVRSTSFVWQP
jgi:hypothetical protein